MLRLRVVEFFDSIRREVDYFTETKIIEDTEHEGFWNERREKQIEGLKQIEQAALCNVSSKRKLEEDEDNEESEKLSQALSDFCFTFEYAGIMFVARVDKYVDDKEIATFKKFLKIESMNNKKREAFLIDGKKAFKKHIVKIETDADKRLKEILTAETAVVDMSWWFNRDYHFDRVEMTCEMFKNVEEFVCPVRIKRVEIRIDFPLYESVFLEEDKLKSIERIHNGFSQAESVAISLRFSLESLNEKNAQKISSAVSSINLDTHTKLEIQFENETCQKYYLDYCDKQKLDGMLRRVKLNKFKLDWFSRVNWSQIYELAFAEYNADLCEADFSSLSSLKSCKFINCVGYLNEWSFLDPVRANLEQLTFGKQDLYSYRTQYNEDDRLLQVSWRMFRGMTKLKQLEMFEYEYECIQLDALGHLFADLTQLKTLSMTINSTSLDQEWCCELPELEELNIWYKNSRELVYKKLNKLRFNLPKLASLDCLIEDYELDLASVFASLSHVDKLSVKSWMFQKVNWFRGFKSSCLGLSGLLNKFDSSMLAGLPNLKSLCAEIDWSCDGQKPNFAADAFHEIPNLETIRLWVTPEWLDSNHSLFDGLHSLKWIHLNMIGYIKSHVVPSLVYFDNLNKFVIVYEFKKRA